MSAFVRQCKDDWEVVRDTELDAMYLCNAWQRAVEKRKTALGQAKDELWSATPAWVTPTDEQHRQRHVDHCRKAWGRAMLQLTVYLKQLEEATCERQITESALTTIFEEGRQRGEINSSQATPERRFIGKNEKEWTCRPELLGERGYFELDESLDPMPSIRRRLAGSCLFMNE